MRHALARLRNSLELSVPLGLLGESLWLAGDVEQAITVIEESASLSRAHCLHSIGGIG
jgi:hypothetical protein